MGMCMKSVKFKVLLNSECLGPIIIGTEGFSRLLMKREMSGELHGYVSPKMLRECPIYSLRTTLIYFLRLTTMKWRL